MRTLVSRRETQAFTWDITSGLDSGAIGAYNAPVVIPHNAIVTAIWATIITPFVAGAGGTVLLGTPLVNDSFNSNPVDFTVLPIASAGGTAAGNNLLLGNAQGGPVTYLKAINSVYMDASQTIRLTIQTAAYTAGKARFDVEYYYPQ